jgi:SpoVK/Ycf46/Vps4 family AAA+-type ATPase
MSTNITDLFNKVLELPDPAAHRRYESLVGLNNVKERLLKQARVLLRPSLLDQWAETHHGRPLAIVEVLRDRPPLFIFGGDVGTGKSTLAETFGDALARNERSLDAVTLMSLSLNARGSGTVGEMTSLITRAFAAVEEEATPMVGEDPGSAVILLVDEADALAQSRENEHMHHEDRAGVNALIRGIDSIAAERRPVITVLCTNRLDAVDPAVRRRAFDEFEFNRPNLEQRIALLTKVFDGTGLDTTQISELAVITGENDERPFGATFSDLTTRLASAVLLDAFPSDPLNFERVATIAAELRATPPFGNAGSRP